MEWEDMSIVYLARKQRRARLKGEKEKTKHSKLQIDSKSLC